MFFSFEGSEGAGTTQCNDGGQAAKSERMHICTYHGGGLGGVIHGNLVDDPEGALSELLPQREILLIEEQNPTVRNFLLRKRSGRSSSSSSSIHW